MDSLGTGAVNELAGLVVAGHSIAGLDVGGLNDVQLHELVVGVQLQVNQLAGLQASVLAAWDARSIWSGDGSRSAAGGEGRVG